MNITSIKRKILYSYFNRFVEIIIFLVLLLITFGICTKYLTTDELSSDIYWLIICFTILSISYSLVKTYSLYFINNMLGNNNDWWIKDKEKPKLLYALFLYLTITISFLIKIYTPNLTVAYLVLIMGIAVYVLLLNLSQKEKQRNSILIKLNEEAESKASLRYEEEKENLERIFNISIENQIIKASSPLVLWRIKYNKPLNKEDYIEFTYKKNNQAKKVTKRDLITYILILKGQTSNLHYEANDNKEISSTISRRIKINNIFIDKIGSDQITKARNNTGESELYKILK